MGSASNNFIKRIYYLNEKKLNNYTKHDGTDGKRWYWILNELIS